VEACFTVHHMDGRQSKNIDHGGYPKKAHTIILHFLLSDWT